MSNNIVAGTLPPGWAQLPALAYLNVSINFLNSSLPQLWQAPLVTLDVSKNQLTGARGGAAARRLARAAGVSSGVCALCGCAWHAPRRPCSGCLCTYTSSSGGLATAMQAARS